MLLLGAAAAGTVSAAIMTTPPEAVTTRSITETHIRFVQAVKRQQTPTNCVYVQEGSSSWHTECSSNAFTFSGGQITQLQTSSVFGLPNGGAVTNTVTTTAQISIGLPTATNQPWKINITPELREKIIDTANDCGDKAKVRKIKRAGGGLSFTWSTMDAVVRGGCLQEISAIMGGSGIMVVDPVGKYFPDYSQLINGTMVEMTDRALHNTNDIWEEYDIPFDSIPTLSKHPASQPSSAKTTTLFSAGGPGGGSSTVTSAASTSTASDQATEEDETKTKTSSSISTTSTTSAIEGPSCPTDAVIDPSDDQGQEGLPPSYCEAITVVTAS